MSSQNFIWAAEMESDPGKRSLLADEALVVILQTVNRYHGNTSINGFIVSILMTYSFQPKVFDGLEEAPLKFSRILYIRLN